MAEVTEFNSTRVHSNCRSEQQIVGKASSALKGGVFDPLLS